MQWYYYDKHSVTDPRGTDEDTKDFLLCDWLVGGFGVGLGCRGEDGVDVDVDKRDELSVDGGGRLAKLPKDPVLEAEATQLANGRRSEKFLGLRRVISRLTP